MLNSHLPHWQGRSISPGTGRGQALVTNQGISFFGGVDPESGVVVERGHELEGQSVAGRVLVFPTGKGSTVGSYTLYRLKQAGKAPAAIINAECETITAVGCIIAEIPCLDQVAIAELHSGQWLLVDVPAQADGSAAAGTVLLLPHVAPALPLPPPLRGSDANSFAEASMRHRLPELIRRMEAEGDWSPESSAGLLALADSMPDAPLPPMADPSAADAARWQSWQRPLVGLTWLQAPWLPAETYLFRRVLQATGYFGVGPDAGKDPYAHQKHQGMAGLSTALLPWAERLEALYAAEPSREAWGQFFGELLHAAVWGNQADLSVWPAGEERPERPAAADMASFLLVDHAAQAGAYLSKLPRPGRIVFVLDNDGLELGYDLLMADMLLYSGLAETVAFQAKYHPTYISDVTQSDFERMLEYLNAAADPPVQRLGQRLRAAHNDEHLPLTTHAFWVSPGMGWEMPPDLWADLHTCDLVISKGDANYRRWLGDRHWPVEAAFEAITAYRPAPLLALRVLKAEVIAGLRPGQAQAMTQQDPSWRTNGRWGVIQLAI